MARSTGIVALEEHALFIVFVSVLLVLMWFSMWGLLDEFVDWAEERYQQPKARIYGGILLGVVLLILLFPESLQRF